MRRSNALVGLAEFMALWPLALAANCTFPAFVSAQPRSADEVEADVLAHPMARGDIIRVEDLERRLVPTVQARFALTADQLVGKEARRAMPAGITLRNSDVAAPTMVHRGDAVTLTYRRGALRITAPGKALADAEHGEGVRVLNLATGHTLDAEATGVGMVEVAAP